MTMLRSAVIALGLVIAARSSGTAVQSPIAGSPIFRFTTSHALIFFTAGEAVRRIAPDYVPYAAANGVWNRGYDRIKPAVDQAWKPYLDGGGTRDEAIAALIARF
jgi:hypothetical protein